MVWIVLIAVVVVALAALAWWSSGQAKPLGRQRREMTRSERHHDPHRSIGNHGGGGFI